MAGRKSLSPAKIAVWILVGLLIVGLAGFGIGDILRGGLSSTVAEMNSSVSLRLYPLDTAACALAARYCPSAWTMAS